MCACVHVCTCACVHVFICWRVHMRVQVLSAAPLSDRLSIFPADLCVSIALPLRATSPSAVPFPLKAALRAAIAALLPAPPLPLLLPRSVFSSGSGSSWEQFSAPPSALVSEVWSLVEQYDQPPSLGALVPASALQPFTAGRPFPAPEVGAIPSGGFLSAFTFVLSRWFVAYSECNVLE